ncbi:MAG TPA: MliC family protein [Terriglobia bacterium]|nr:MliC family protein [Terriglobia bacterium]
MITMSFRPIFVALGVVACAAISVSAAGAQSALPTGVVSEIRQAFGDLEIHYFDGSVDLNSDGKPELLVYVAGPMVCGSGGCNLLVFTPVGNGYRLVSRISVTRPPIRASNNRSSGWRDLIVHVSGGGARSEDVALSFDGKSYPKNPTTPGPRVKPTTAANAQIVIGEFGSLAEGKLLGPAAKASSGPSFDCAKATSPAEKLVCGNTELAELDRKLAAVYARAMSPESPWPPEERDVQRGAQRTWMAERDACSKGKDISHCVRSSYQRRLTVLQIKIGDLMAPTPVGYRCKGIEGTPVTVAYYKQTEPPSAVITVGGRQTVVFQSPSGSGARYTDNGVEFWDHQGEATLEWYGKKYSCVV